jgi:DNA-directed RNA polymerase specialized sigma24 family protein
MTKATHSDLLVEAFCRKHWRRLRAFAVRSVGSWTEAEDVVQELFLGLVRNGKVAGLADRSPGEQSAYLSLRLNCLLRSRWRNARRARRLMMVEALPLDDGHAEEVATKVSPASEIDRAWLAACIKTALERLRQQTHEAAWKQIGPRLEGEDARSGQTGAQRVALHRARQKLRELIREEMNGAFQDWDLQQSCQAFSKASATRRRVVSSRGLPIS